MTRLPSTITLAADSLQRAAFRVGLQPMLAWHRGDPARIYSQKFITMDWQACKLHQIGATPPGISNGLAQGMHGGIASACSQDHITVTGGCAPLVCKPLYKSGMTGGLPALQPALRLEDNCGRGTYGCPDLPRPPLSFQKTHELLGFSQALCPWHATLHRQPFFPLLSIGNSAH